MNLQGIVKLLLLILIISCNNHDQEPIPNEPSILVEEINPTQDEGFNDLIGKMNRPSNGRISESFLDKIDFSTAIKVSNEHDSTIRYSLYYEEENQGFSNIIFKKHINEENFYVITYLPLSRALNKNEELGVLENYSGDIVFKNSALEEVYRFSFRNGEIIDSNTSESSNGRTTSCGGGGGGIIDGGWIGTGGGSAGSGGGSICFTIMERKDGVLVVKRKCISFSRCVEDDEIDLDYHGIDSGNEGGNGPIGIVTGINLIPAYLDLNEKETEWLNYYPYVSNLIADFNKKENYSADAKLLSEEILDDVFYGELSEANAGIMALEMDKAGFLSGPYNAQYFNKINPYFEADLTDPTTQIILAQYFSAKCAVLKINNPTWSDTRIYWEASKDLIHFGLDVAGLVPVVGEVFDAVNGVIYTIEGDGLNATLSFASTVPIAGWFAAGTKMVMKGPWTAVVKANGVMDFGTRNSNLFRKNLGLTKGDGMHAHHIIPWENSSHPLIQKAAKSDKAFHMNEVLNGIAIPKGDHLTGHLKYSIEVKKILNDFNIENPNLSFDDSFSFIEGFIHYLGDLIKNNPGKNLGDIADLIEFQ